ncbi:hypothetical protein HYFRA_00009482 [Hymenoscyphus fraxineus]|uniref:Clr5 domain-containing protein n=1 Tax=Hymenoscyphus fraxineus TaxID=746836 RepID=A0A9N9KX74_9HELO|nr:hypothetical protein HYFRA_00009482 [Hymenoscyphus fraxineus]
MAPSHDEWLAVKQTLFDAWLGGKPLNTDFIKWMKEDHGKGQYERKFKEWGWRKNLTEDEMQFALSQIEARKQLHKKSEVTLDIGDRKIVIPPERTRKRKYREGYSKPSTSEPTEDPTVSQFSGISVHTPPPFQDDPSGTDCILHYSFAARGRSIKKTCTQDSMFQHALVVNCDGLPSLQLLRFMESPEQAGLRNMILKSLRDAEEYPHLSEPDHCFHPEIIRNRRLRLVFTNAELAPRMRRTIYLFVFNIFCSGIDPELPYQGGLTMNVRSTIQQMLSSAVMSFKNTCLNTSSLQPIYEAAKALLLADKNHNIFAGDKLRKMVVALNLDHVDMVAILLKEGVDSNASTIIKKSQCTLLAVANSIEASWLLIDAGAKMNATFTVVPFPVPRFYVRQDLGCHDWTALCCASYATGFTTLVQFLLKKGACPPLSGLYPEPSSSLGTFSNDPRMEFQKLQTENSEVFWILRRARLRVKFSFDLMQYPLQSANEDQIASWIACDDENVNQGFPAFQDWHNMLLTSIEKNRPKYIDLLLKTRLNVNAQIHYSTHGRSLIEVAQNLGHHEIVSQLLLRGAHEFVQDPMVLSVKEAVENGQLSRKVLGGSIKLEKLLHEKLFHHTGLRSVFKELVRFILHDLPWEIRVKAPPQCQQFVLITAIENGELEYATKLVQQGVNLKLLEGNRVGRYPEDQHDTILQLLCSMVCYNESSGQVVETMLDYGALQDEPEPEGYKGYKALGKVFEHIHFEEFGVCLDVVKVLLRAGASPIAPPSQMIDGKITSVAHKLFFNAFAVEVNLKISEQADAFRNAHDVLELMISRGVDIDAVCNGEGVEKWSAGTLLQFSISSRAWNCVPDLLLRIVSLLIESGANINAPAADDGGRTALQAAAVSGSNPNEKLISFLLQKGADVNAPAAEIAGITALQGAAMNGHITILKRLLELGADPNAPGAEIRGRTALEGAAERGRLDTVILLLNNGAIPTMEAVWFAEKEAHYVIRDIIRKRLPEDQRTAAFSREFHERMVKRTYGDECFFDD